jgi:hypothetical protein
MLEVVRQQLLEDQQRSDKVANYCLTNGYAIWWAVEYLFNNYVKDYFTGDINDTSLAPDIVSGIYNQLP